LPLSRAQIQRRITEGEVQVGGEVVRSPSRRVAAGEHVVLRMPPPSPTVDLPEEIPLSILFEDAHLIVIDKPAGLVVHPATSHERGTLVNALLHHCGAGAMPPLSIGGERRPGIVHRLDKDTSGVMVVAKDEPTLVDLQKQFAEHSLTRRYLALVEGVLPEEGTYRTLYGRHSYDRKRFSSRVKTGKTAVTHFRVVERVAGATLVEVRLETGRTHQIRVHFADHGHPVVGDPTYGRKPKDVRIRAAAARLQRQALHAAVLGFRHPITGAWIERASEPPDDMKRAIEFLRG
jgi:23S rRNA pseudouridine1911/1915/1917 synthase